MGQAYTCNNGSQYVGDKDQQKVKQNIFQQALYNPTLNGGTEALDYKNKSFNMWVAPG